MARRRPAIFWIVTVLLVGLIGILTALVLTSRGEDDGDDRADVLRIDLIDDAVSATREALGPDVPFYEVNATPDLVNVFVATESADGTGQATSYVYTEDGGLTAPEVIEAPTGSTFTADLVAFQPDTILDAALAELPSSVPRLFSIAGPTAVTSSTGVEYRIVFDSASGGSLAVLVEPDGSIIGVDAE